MAWVQRRHTPCLSHIMLRYRTSLWVVPFTVLACAAPANEDVEVQESPVIENATSIVRRPDGLFDVTCEDGRTEVVSADQIRSNEVCVPVSGGACSNDLFDPCFAEQLSIDREGIESLRAKSDFLASREMNDVYTPKKVVLGRAEVRARTRTCETHWTSPRTTTCTDWAEMSAFEAYEISEWGRFIAKHTFETASIRPTVWLERSRAGRSVDLHVGEPNDHESPIWATCAFLTDCDSKSWRTRDNYLRLSPSLRLDHIRGVVTPEYLYQRVNRRQHVSGPLETSFPNDRPRVDRETQIVLFAPFSR
jgi:hypothetical protein